MLLWADVPAAAPEPLIERPGTFGAELPEAAAFFSMFKPGTMDPTLLAEEAAAAAPAPAAPVAAAAAAGADPLMDKPGTFGAECEADAALLSILRPGTDG